MNFGCGRVLTRDPHRAGVWVHLWVDTGLGTMGGLHCFNWSSGCLQVWVERWRPTLPSGSSLQLFLLLKQEGRRQGTYFKRMTAPGQDINCLEQNRSKMVDKLTFTRVWVSVFSWTPKSLWMVSAPVKLRCLLLGKKAITNLDSIWTETSLCQQRSV